ncbi:hypothetical protein BpHYR1_050519 [Brachionus plicatilis]|uniref:Uncharacterized protein n=1 Tax=Brachionus plicatilis TaxID=10195 RepID=A0A3M7P8S3_BRAPC|nr:hypothetical protein BpHYR1_050519 [Brachionus plicatilis]
MLINENCTFFDCLCLWGLIISSSHNNLNFFYKYSIKTANFCRSRGLYQASQISLDVSLDPEEGLSIL